MSSHYDKVFGTFIDRPFTWLWALITWFYADPKISYHEAYKIHFDIQQRRYKK